MTQPGVAIGYVSPTSRGVFRKLIASAGLLVMVLLLGGSVAPESGRTAEAAAEEWLIGEVTARTATSFTLRPFDGSANLQFTGDASTPVVFYPNTEDRIPFADLSVGHVAVVVPDLASPQRASFVVLPRFDTPATETPDRSLAMTYYYYWYDSTTGQHLQEQDGIPYHFVPTPEPTWRSADWHKRQMSDMTAAGIDVMLPVFWGFDRQYDGWSTDGLPVLARAWQEMKTAGLPRPQIGMFFDTTILAGRDLRTAENKAYFYQNVKEFFNRIPSEQWALVNGKPLIFFFTADFVTGFDQSTFNYLSDQFLADFGVRPYGVREYSWNYEVRTGTDGKRMVDYQKPISTHNNYLWGAAMKGYNPYVKGDVAAVGPGYDDTLIAGREGFVAPRNGGAFYTEAFRQATASSQKMVVIETWNELHEGSGVSETVEFGRQYIDLTKQLLQEFKAARAAR